MAKSCETVAVYIGMILHRSGFWALRSSTTQRTTGYLSDCCPSKIIRLTQLSRVSCHLIPTTLFVLQIAAISAMGKKSPAIREKSRFGQELRCDCRAEPGNPALRQLPSLPSLLFGTRFSNLFGVHPLTVIIPPKQTHKPTLETYEKVQ
jgi:hypothetical protein